MMSLAQKTLALVVIAALNVLALVLGVAFAGVFGLFVALAFLVTSGAAAWRIASL